MNTVPGVSVCVCVGMRVSLNVSKTSPSAVPTVTSNIHLSHGSQFIHRDIKDWGVYMCVLWTNNRNEEEQWDGVKLQTAATIPIMYGIQRHTCRHTQTKIISEPRGLQAAQLSPSDSISLSLRLPNRNAFFIYSYVMLLSQYMNLKWGTRPYIIRLVFSGRFWAFCALLSVYREP